MAILRPGQKVGNYEVRRLIKEVFYCETYRVEDEKEEPFFLKLFIIKNTPSCMMTDDGKVRSIAITSKLKHKNLISFVEAGSFQDESVGECQYVVTNYFHGELLADKLQREGKLPQEEAERIFKQILAGLKYMHDRDLLHNDITPRNIMLSERTGEAEIIDLSHVSSYVKGTPPFDVSDLDVRYQSTFALWGFYNWSSDIFSAVGVFYTMLSGRVPWDVTFPKDADYKTRKDMTIAARRVPLPIEPREAPVELYVVIKLAMIIHGMCQYKSIAELRKALKYNDDDSTKKDLSPKIEPENALQMDIQKSGGNGFKDIAGMNDLKQMLTQKVIFILKNKERAEKYKLSPPNGMLLYGPPGCGKSFFAEKFAEETGFSFMLVKASDLGSIYIHGTQGRIAQLFQKAKENAPTVICFDEFDAFVPDRSGFGADHQAGEVNEFLSQLNNCSKRGIFVIATSNRPDIIDPAVLRTGRIDRQIYVPLPDLEARREMFLLHLEGRPCEDIDAEKLASLTDGYIASDIAYIVNDAAMCAAFCNQPISQQTLEAAISSIRPSINKEVVKIYEDIRCKMEGIDRKNMLPKIGFIK